MATTTGTVVANPGATATGTITASTPASGSTATATGKVTANAATDTVFLRVNGAWVPATLYVRTPGAWIPATGTSTTVVTDPTVTLLSNRTYPAATPLTAGSPWEQVQLPRVRGTVVNRINGLTSAIPGSGAPTSAMKVELFAHSNNDVTATATAAATASATTISLNTGTTPVFALDFLLNNRTQEKLRATAVSGTTVTVIRGTQGYSAPAAINSGDTFLINGGDVSDSGGNYDTSRSEVRGDYATPSSTVPSGWPHPVGSTRFFNWQIMLPSLLFPTPTGTNWVTLTQLKGQFGGSPPVSIEASTAGTFKLQLGAATDVNFGNLTRDVWHEITLGVHLSPVGSVGWAEVWFEGVNVIPRFSVATMEYQSDGVTVDPIYIKQGIYRLKDWNVGHTAYFGPLRIADTGTPFGAVL